MSACTFAVCAALLALALPATAAATTAPPTHLTIAVYPNGIDGGSVHRYMGRTRHSKVTHYYFVGCQYFSPLSSYGGYRHLFRDEWVR